MRHEIVFVSANHGECVVLIKKTYNYKCSVQLTENDIGEKIILQGIMNGFHYIIIINNATFLNTTDYTAC